MKKLALIAVLLLAVPAHAANIWLGTPFASGGQTWVPVMGSNLPDDLVTVGNINIVTTGTAAAANDIFYGPGGGNVWPNNYPQIPTGVTQVYYDDIGLGYPEQYVSCSYGYVCNSAQASGMLGAFPVTGSGTVALNNAVGSAEDCNAQSVSITVSTASVEVGGGEGGGGGGGQWEDPVTVGEPTAPKPAKAAVKRSTWATIKALYK